MFKGLGNLGNIASMVGSLQHLPDKMKDLNERMKGETVTVSSGCSRVTVVMNGVGHIEAIEITDGLTGHELEQAVREASNAAAAAAKQLYAEAISQMVSDMNLNLPGIDGVLKSLTGGG